MAATVGVAFVDVRPDMDGFNKDLARQAGQAGSGFGAMFKKAVVPAMAAAGAAAGVFLAKSVSDASNLQETLSKVTTIFGDSADEIVDWSKTAATSMGLSQEAALDAAGSFGNLFQQIGFATGVSQDMSTNLVGMASDLASFHNIAGGAAEVTDMMSAAMRGEYDSLQRVIPTINAAAVEQKALAQTGKDSAKELTNQEKAAATYALIMEGAGAATGDFARTSDGLANQQRILAANFQDISAKVGTALLPAVNAIVSGINDWLLPAFSAIWTVVEQDILPVLTLLHDTFVQHQGLFTGIAAVITAVFVPALAVLAIQWLRTGIQAVVSGAMQVASMVSQVAWTVVMGAAYLWVFAVMVAGWIRTGIQATISAVKIVAAWIMQKAQMLVTVALAVASFAVLIAQWVALGVAALVNAAIVAAGWLIAFWPVALVVAAIIAVIAIVWIFWDEIVAALTKVKDFLLKVFTVIKDTVLRLWQTLWENVKRIVTTIWKWIGDKFNTIKTTIITIFTTVKDTVTNIWNSISSTIGGVIENIKGFVNGLWDTIKSVVNLGIGALNTLINGANKVTGVLPGDMAQIPTIPKLAGGGIVTRPTLALIGEAGPEAVVPLGHFLPPGAGGDQPIYLQVKIGDRDITDLIEDATREKSDRLARMLVGGRRL